MKHHFYYNEKNLRFLRIIVLVITSGILFNNVMNGQNSSGSNAAGGADIEPYVAVEEMPMYPGGNSAMVDYISNNIKYPVRAMERGIQGKVVVKFCVTAKGSVTMVSVLKSVDTDLDKEAMRIIQTMNNFIPGKKDGVPVPVWYMIPITFSL